MFWRSVSALVEPNGMQPEIIQTFDEEDITDRTCSSASNADERSAVTSPPSVASTGLAQMFGLEARAAILAVLVDVMVFTGDTLSLEALVPLGAGVAAVLGLIVYRIQRKWYGDDHESALIKAMILGLLTAIPVPLTPLIAVPGGIMGILKAVRRK